MEHQGKKLHTSKYVISWDLPESDRWEWYNPYCLVVDVDHLQPDVTFTFQFVLAPTTRAATEMQLGALAAAGILSEVGLAKNSGVFGEREELGIEIYAFTGVFKKKGLKGSDGAVRGLIDKIIGAFQVDRDPNERQGSIDRQYLVMEGGKPVKESVALTRALKRSIQRRRLVTK
jgi:hypothetical protein